MRKSGKTREIPSREYIRQLLEACKKADAEHYKKAISKLNGKTVQVILEAGKDEFFYLENGGSVADDLNGSIDQADIFLRVSPEVLEKMLMGEFTPVES